MERTYAYFKEVGTLPGGKDLEIIELNVKQNYRLTLTNSFLILSTTHDDFFIKSPNKYSNFSNNSWMQKQALMIADLKRNTICTFYLFSQHLTEINQMIIY